MGLGMRLGLRRRRRRNGVLRGDLRGGGRRRRGRLIIKSFEMAPEASLLFFSCPFLYVLLLLRGLEHVAMARHD